MSAAGLVEGHDFDQVFTVRVRASKTDAGRKRPHSVLAAVPMMKVRNATAIRTAKCCMTAPFKSHGPAGRETAAAGRGINI